jgi:hypothetical protein
MKPGHLTVHDPATAAMIVVQIVAVFLLEPRPPTKPGKGKRKR